MSAMREAAHSKKNPESSSASKGILALIVLVIVLVVVQFALSNKGAVKGVSTSTEQSIHEVENKKVAEAKERLQGTLEDQVNTIKNQVTQLDPKDIAESSPQVQKVIEDLKNLQGVPKDELKKTCENICRSL